MTNIYEDLVKQQRSYYRKGITKPLKFRKEMLKGLKNSILKNEQAIIEAVHKDLGKSEAEVVSMEIGTTLSEINTMLKHLPKWTKKKRVKTNILNSVSKAYTIREPWGITLIIGPWNYPFQLTMAPLVAAIAGGNTAIVKPSELSSNTAKVIEKVIGEAFSKEFVAVVQGGVAETSDLMDHRYDKVFFTGSPKVGSIIMEKAAKHLTPVVLELGGKSPTIIDKSADLEIATRRIAFGKGTNAGQTCVAPDYVLIHEEIKEKFYGLFEKNVKAFFTENPIQNKEYGRIINKANYHRIKKYLEEGKIIYGGDFDDDALKIGITVVEVRDFDKSIMREEIFGPVLPVVTFQSYDEIIDIIHLNPDPLACYIFSENQGFVNQLLHDVPFGGGCVNDTIMHLTNEHLPFGGRGQSGMGSYHGKYSFEAFTHEKSVLHSPTWIDIKLKYPKEMKKRLALVKKFMYGNK